MSETPNNEKFRRYHVIAQHPRLPEGAQVGCVYAVRGAFDGIVVDKPIGTTMPCPNLCGETMTVTSVQGIS